MPVSHKNAASYSSRKGRTVSLQTTARQFVELCNQSRNFDVMHAMYAPDIVSVEPSGEDTSANAYGTPTSERVQAQPPHGCEKVRGPFSNGPNHFAVHLTFEITPKATGQQITVEEVGVYTVKYNKITRAQFFNEGAR